MSGSALYETFARAPLAFERGEGVWLIDDQRRALSRFRRRHRGQLARPRPSASGRGADRAGRQALARLQPLRDSRPGALAERLVERTFADKVFFTNSGAEALECAIKTARRYHFVNGHPERFRIITFEGAFHGRTLATIAAGGQQKYLEGFGPKVDGFDQVAVRRHRRRREGDHAGDRRDPDRAGAGRGRHPRRSRTQSLKRLRELCDEHGLLLIFDEVQCGIGRTGKLFAHEWAGVTPDIMAIAKGIGGGFPMGACLATDEAAVGMTAGMHGTTFGGNPLAMAVGNAVLDVVLADGFLDEVARKALLLQAGAGGDRRRIPRGHRGYPRRSA